MEKDRTGQTIDFIDLKVHFQPIRDEIYRAIREVAESQYFILGPKVEAFERNAASYCRVKHAVGCASGTDALILAIAACGIEESDEVITTPFTFFSTASSITKIGAKPVFADIEEGTFNIDATKIEEAVTSRTRGIIPVHLFGQNADMGPVMEIARRKNLVVIEDAAQSIGAEYNDEERGAWLRSGTIGDAGCISFFPTKNLGAFGDAGMMVTNDDSIASRMRLLRVHGAEKRYYHTMIGWNSRLDAIQAAVLDVKLKHLERWSSERRQNADRYDRLFTEAGLPASGKIKLPVRMERSTHIFNQYTIRASRRDELRDYLSSKKIGSEIYYPVPLHLQRCFSYLNYSKGNFPNAEQAADEVLSLPIYPGLPPAHQEAVVSAIADFYRK